MARCSHPIGIMTRAKKGTHARLGYKLCSLSETNASQNTGALPADKKRCWKKLLPTTASSYSLDAVMSCAVKRNLGLLSLSWEISLILKFKNQENQAFNLRCGFRWEPQGRDTIWVHEETLDKKRKRKQNKVTSNSIWDCKIKL